MSFSTLSMAFSDVSWIVVAFLLGLLAKQIKLPPMVGYLLAGFLIQKFPHANTSLFEQLSDLGITLLLFTIGLKINVRELARPHIWAVTTIHTTAVVMLFTAVFWLFAWLGWSHFASLSIETLVMIAFAFSFSSTVFVVKILEDKGEYYSRHGRVAVGILVVQDIFAVLFLAFSTGELPSTWALSLILLWPLRLLLARLLNDLGHDELLVLYGFILSMGGSQLFEWVGLKGDLGALLIGMLLANHPRANDMAKTMMSFKDLFLLGFFISIGLMGQLNWDALWLGLLLLLMVAIKSWLFYWLMTRFKLRARTSLMATLNLSNYSEFGLIVAALCVANEWLPGQWLVTMAVAMALSQIGSAILNAQAHQHFVQFRDMWRRWQLDERLHDDKEVDISGVEVIVIGIGRVGCAAYDKMHAALGDRVLGIDINPKVIDHKSNEGRRLIQGDPTDADFWDRVLENHELKLVMIALPNFTPALGVIEQLKFLGYQGRIAATTRYAEEIEIFHAAGVHSVFNVFTQAGAGFANQVMQMGMCDEVMKGQTPKL
jgi:predicted Kef-type K+ transport protein